MTNPFRGLHPSHFGSASDIVPVTPDDDADLPPGCVALYVGGAGDLAYRTFAGGDVVRVVPVTDFTLMPVSAVRVMEATTATDIHALLVR